MEFIKSLLGMIVKVLADQPNPKGDFLALVPESVRPWLSCVLSVVPIMVVFPLLFAVATLLERKGLGRIQNRYGPNRVGPWGILQPVADGLKMLTKEDIVPRAADQVVHFLAPITLLVPVFLTFSVLPFGHNLVPLDMPVGLLFFFAVGAATEVSVFMAGWGSRNKYSLLGAMRAIAQMISYEMPLVISAVTVVMVAGSLSLVNIVDAQQGSFLHWNVCTPWGLAGFLLFLTAAVAESNRSPFDIPEGESEIIAGHMIEYSGFKYALFFMAEYLGMFAVSGMAITLFLGGYHPPFPFLNVVPAYVWFFGKLLGFIAFFIWLRGTLPRLRVDQLMGFAWKFMLPMTLLNIFVAAIWHFSRNWGLPGGGVLRWLICLAILGASYYLLGRAVEPTTGPRVYRYAD